MNKFQKQIAMTIIELQEIQDFFVPYSDDRQKIQYFISWLEERAKRL